jgi:hypothetical protein
MSHEPLPTVPPLAVLRPDPAVQCTCFSVHPGGECRCVDDDIDERRCENIKPCLLMMAKPERTWGDYHPACAEVGYMRTLRGEACHRKRLPHVMTGQLQRLLLRGRSNRREPRWKSKIQAETAGAKSRLRRSKCVNGSVDSGEGGRVKEKYDIKVA